MTESELAVLLERYIGAWNASSSSSVQGGTVCCTDAGQAEAAPSLLRSWHGHLSRRGERSVKRGQQGACRPRLGASAPPERSGHNNAGSDRCVSIVGAVSLVAPEAGGVIASLDFVPRISKDDDAGGPMSRYAVAHLDEIDEISDGRCPSRPIRYHFGITSFGLNAWTGRDAGDRIINEHDEGDGGDEERTAVAPATRGGTGRRLAPGAGRRRHGRSDGPTTARRAAPPS